MIRPTLSTNRSRALAFTGLLALAGCSSQALQQADNDSATATQVADQEAKEAPEAPVRPFDADTLYDLLVAEVAGARSKYHVALQKYTKQAVETRDPAVVARATWLSSSLNARKIAMKMAQLWTEVEPDSLEARRYATHYLSEARQLTNAFPHALVLLQHGEGEPLRSLASYTGSASNIQREQLLKLYEALPQEQANHPDVLLTHATLLWQQQQSEAALASAKQIDSEQSQFESAQLLISQILQQQGKKDDAIRTVQKALKKLPESKRLRLQSAQLWADKDLLKAREELATLVTQHPDDHSLIYSLALISSEVGMQEDAELLFRRILDSEKKGTEAHFQLARLLETRGDTTEAISHYQQVKSGPMVIAAASRYSSLMQLEGQTNQARDYLQQLRNEQPDHVAALYQVESELLEQAELPEEALQALANGLEHAPNSAQLLYARSLLNERQGNIDDAEQDLRTILEHQPDNAMSLNALGYLLTNHSERYDEALALINNALEIKPDDIPTIDSLGWVLYKLGRLEEALTHLRTAFASLPDPEIAAHLGEVLWAMGKYEEALAIWQQSLDQNPDAPIVLQTMERLNATPATETEAIDSETIDSQ